MKSFSMYINTLKITLIVVSCTFFSPAWAHTDPETQTAFQSYTDIPPAIAKDAGIEIVKAESGNIERHIPVYGRLVTPPTKQAQVKARFPGLIVALHANTGDKVKAGQLLAVVESNESLRRYEVRAPITGQIQERWLNAGELTEDNPIFTLLDQSELWAELAIFPSQRNEIKVGQRVHLRHNGHDHMDRIFAITPAQRAGDALPFMLARVVVKNDHQDMAAGDRVLADVDAEHVLAEVRVHKEAVQEIDGQTVVFVHHQGRYEPRPIRLGVTDERFAQVLAGLQLGEEYVSVNSYLIKADLSKSATELDH